MNLWSDKGGTCATCQHWGDLNKTGTKEGCKLLRKKFISCSSACFLSDMTATEAILLGQKK